MVKCVREPSPDMPSPRDYTWSSYNTYIKDTLTNFVDKYKILDLFSHNTNKAVREFVQFSNKDNDDSFIDNDENKSYCDILIHSADEARKFIDIFMADKKISLQELKNKANIAVRDELIGFLRDHSNLTIMDISKILDLNRGAVQRAKLGH